MKCLHLLYHELRPVPSNYSYVMECSAFEAHCDLFAALAVSPGDSLLPQITFDDGHRSNYEHALPILEKRHLKAQFFITAGWTGERQGYMDWPELKALRGAGHRIGAHGWSHKLLTHCNTAELHKELSGARKRLEDGLGEAIETLSLPGGRASSRVFDACWDAGYEQVYTSVPIAEELATTPRSTVGRMNVRRDISPSDLAQILSPNSGALAAIQRSHRIKSLAKSLLGDKVYASVWALLNKKEAQTEDFGAPAE